MNKKLCIISANCQGAYIEILLKNHPDFSKDFEVKCFVNYKKEIVPVHLLKIADILIYQPLKEKWKQLSAEYLESNINPKALKIRIPYLTFPLYFPSYTYDFRNIRTKSNPSGYFPYGDKIILDLLNKGLSDKDILRLIFSRNFLKTKLDFTFIYKEYVELFSEMEKRRDQKLLPFILDNFKEIKLFVTYNHPSPIMMIYQVNDILYKLGYKQYDKSDETLSYLQYIHRYELPINPLVAEETGLKFCEDWWNETYCIYGKYLTYEEYIKAYINYDISKVGQALPEPTITFDNYNNNTQSLTQEFKNNQILFITLLDIKLMFKIVRDLYQSIFGKLLDEEECMFGSYYEKYPGFFYDYISYLKDYYRSIYKIICGRLSYNIINTLLKRPVIKILLIQNPLIRILKDFKLRVEVDNISEESLLEFVSSEENRNLYTKLLGRNFNILSYWRDFQSGKIGNPDEYYRVIADITKTPPSDTELNNAISAIASFDLVGITDNIVNFGLKLSELLGVSLDEIIYKNYMKTEDKSLQISKELINIIKKSNEYDFLLYKYVRRGLKLN